MSTYLRNTWYVAALSPEIGREPKAIRILGEAVVLYRTQAGAAVARADGEILHARQFGARHLQHIGAGLVGCTRLPGGQRVQGRTACTHHALEHAAHLGREAGVVDVQIGHRGVVFQRVT